MNTLINFGWIALLGWGGLMYLHNPSDGAVVAGTMTVPALGLLFLKALLNR